MMFSASSATRPPVQQLVRRRLLLIITPPILLEVQVTADFLVTVGGHPVPGRHQLQQGPQALARACYVP